MQTFEHPSKSVSPSRFDSQRLKNHLAITASMRVRIRKKESKKLTMKTFRLFISTLVIAMLLVACAPSAPAAPSQEQIAAAVEATLSAMPAAPQASPVPTYTPYPTYTPFPTEAPTQPPLPTLGPTSTNVPTIAPPAPSSGGGTGGSTGNSKYACTILSQSPENGDSYGSRDSFDATWTVQNTGTDVWEVHGIDYAYISGTKLHTHSDAYNLPSNVGIGGKIKLTVDMLAPKAAGNYTTTWGLETGSNVFCTLSLTINVR